MIKQKYDKWKYNFKMYTKYNQNAISFARISDPGSKILVFFYWYNVLVD